MSENILANFRRGGGRERRHLRTPELFEHNIEAKIIRPEIVAPHGKTMRFVNGKERDRRFADRLHERAAAKTFRRNVNKFVIAPGQSLNPLSLLGQVERAIDERRRNVASHESVHLIFHKRDERRDDDGRSFEHERRQLIAE